LYYIGVDLLEELHLLNHGFDFSLKIDSDKSGVVAVLSHLREVSFKVLTQSLKNLLRSTFWYPLSYKFLLIFFMILLGFVGEVVSLHLGLGSLVGEFIDHLAESSEFFLIFFSKVRGSPGFELQSSLTESFNF